MVGDARNCGVADGVSLISNRRSESVKNVRRCGARSHDSILSHHRLYRAAVLVAGRLMCIDKFARFLRELGIPMPKLNVILAGSTECFGGLL